MVKLKAGFFVAVFTSFDQAITMSRLDLFSSLLCSGFVLLALTARHFKLNIEFELNLFRPIKLTLQVDQAAIQAAISSALRHRRREPVRAFSCFEVCASRATATG